MRQKQFTKTVFAAALAAVIAATSVPALAAEGAKGPKRLKVIDFEDDLVEGLNKRPLDSLASLSERDKKKKKIHLYRKRVSFRTETLDMLRDLRFAQ